MPGRSAAMTVALTSCLLGLLPSCSRGEGSESAQCAPVLRLATATERLAQAEGDLGGVRAAFDHMGDALERSVAPPALEQEWQVASQATRYYAVAAEGAGRGAVEEATRSADDARRWQSAFATITDHARSECGTGWRTAFDDCRHDDPPPGAASSRLLLPCREH